MKILFTRVKKCGVDGCVDGGTWCRGRKHGACWECGAVTSDRTVRIEPKTLRRRIAFVCTSCTHDPRAQMTQDRLRRDRTERDLSMVTDPLDNSRLGAGRLAMQYSGDTRATIRAFLASGEQHAVVDGITVATLNQSIQTLGLIGVYAEERAGMTTLRRVA